LFGFPEKMARTYSTAVWNVLVLLLDSTLPLMEN